MTARTTYTLYQLKRLSDERLEVLYTVICVPTSTARPLGMPKYWLASFAERASQMNRRSCQRGIAECAAGRKARRDRKNEVRITSKAMPFARHAASARGTFGSSMKPNRSVTRAKDAE